MSDASQDTSPAQDPLVIFTPSGKRGRVPSGTSVLAAARQLGVDLDSVCGGRGVCSKCQVQPSFGDHSKHGITANADALTEFNAVEERYDRVRGLKTGRRLGCQACVTGDVVLDVPPESQVHKQVVRKAATTRHIEMDSATRLYYVEVAEADMHDPSGDWERTEIALKTQFNLDGVTLPFALLAPLQKALLDGKNTATLAVHTARAGAAKVVGVWPKFAEPNLYGLAVDLGSTTIAAHLTNLVTGEVKASGGVMNPQIRFGEDLMSRVSYAMMNEGGAADMTVAVREAMNTLAAELTAEAGLVVTDIYETVFVMNPVMHHLIPFLWGKRLLHWRLLRRWIWTPATSISILPPMRRSIFCR